MIIIIDTREQVPYAFSGITPPPTVEVATLASGDYSVKGLEEVVAIERKSLSDCFGSFGQGRERFQRELERLARLRFAAVVIEKDFHIIATRPPARTRLPPKTVIRSMAAWAIRYGVHFYPCPNRAFAERWTWILLDRFWRDVKDGKIKL